MKPKRKKRRKEKMSDHFPHLQFGIDEIYFLEGIHSSLLEKLHHRAVSSLDVEDKIVQKYVSQDMILIFHKRVTSQNFIYRFLEFLAHNSEREIFIKSNTLLNDEELFSAIKSKKYMLVTSRMLLKDT